MDELEINKSGFDLCYDRLNNLAAKLSSAPALPESMGEDTSMTGQETQECYNELLTIIKDLIYLIEDTAKDVRLTQARYVLSDK